MKRMLCIVMSVAGLAGCIGPAMYLNTTALQARRAVADAKAAGAEQLAPYEYWSAVVYLRMSREKAGKADFEDAYKYGKKAVKMGKLAKKLASEKGQAGPTASQMDSQVAPAAAPESDPEGL